MPQWYYHNMVNAMNDEGLTDEFWVTDNPEDDGSGSIIASGLTEGHARIMSLSPKMLKACRMTAALDWSPHTGNNPGECMTGGACPVCEALTLIQEVVDEAEGI